MDLKRETLENNWNHACFYYFQCNLNGFFYLWILQDKHNASTWSVNIHNLFAHAAKQVRKACKRLDFLPVSKACTNKFNIFQQCTATYISYISKRIRFIGPGNRNTCRKPMTYHKSQTHFITYTCSCFR